MITVHQPAGKKIHAAQFAQYRYNAGEFVQRRVKKTSLLHHTGITLLALLGATVVVAVVTIIVAALPIFAQGPEDILPEKGTVAVFFRPTETSLRRFEPWLPGLARWTPDAAMQVLALVDLPRGGQGSVAFIRRSVNQEHTALDDALARDVGPFTVRVSSPDLWPLLTGASARLGRSKSFRALARGENNENPWAFLASRVLPHPVTTGDLIFRNLVLTDVQSIMITTTATGTTAMEIYAEHAVWDDLPSMPSSTPLPLTFFSFAVPLPATVYTQLLAALPRTERTIAESLILTWIADVFGNDVSLETDLLPLVSREGSLSLVRTASGGTAFLLRGEGKRSDATPVLSRLHDSVRAGFSTTRMTRHVLDKGRFVSTNLRDDTTLIQETDRNIGSWHIRTTTHAGDGRGLATAASDASVLISNDPSVLEQALHATGSALPALTRATGTLQRTKMSGLPGLLLSPSPLLPEGTAYVDWSLSRRGSVTTIVFASHN